MIKQSVTAPLFARFPCGMCLDLVFVSIFDFLCVVGGARLAGCTSGGGSRSCLTRSPMFRGRCSSARANGATCAVESRSFIFVFYCCAVTDHETRASFRRGVGTRSCESEYEGAPSKLVLGW